MKEKILSIIRNIEYKKENSFELSKSKRVFIACVQNHGNLGDQALTLAAKKMLSTYLSNYYQVELTVSNLLDKKFLDSLEIKASDVVIIQGGGFLGNLWMDIYTALINTINVFKNNQIIIFPQSYSFTKDENGDSEALKVEKLFLSCKKIEVFMRDKISYDLMREHFRKFKNVHLCPDSVFYLKDDQDYSNVDRNGALFLLRSDKERKITDAATTLIRDTVSRKYGNIKYSDTVIKGRITKKNRLHKVAEKLKQISSYNIVITDRLHGMIFAYLTNTKCIVLPNNNHKIKGAYEWVKDCSYVSFLEDISNFANLFDSVTDNDNNILVNDKYNELFLMLEKINND